jgi:hypothetical protein
MQNTLKTLLAASAATMLMAGSAMAQSSTMSPTATPATPSASPSSSGAMAPSAPTAASPTSTMAAPKAAALDDATGSTGVIGLTVKSSDNSKIGKIDNIVASADGKIDKVVIDVGGVLGVGGKDVAVDWKDLQFNTAQHEAQIDMTKDQLKNAPAYRPDRHADASMDNTSK